MKVLYDHQVFEQQNIGGISRYFAELIKLNPEAALSLRYTDNIYLQEECFKKYKLLPLPTSAKITLENFIIKKKFKGKWRLFQLYKCLFIKDNTKRSIDCIKKSKFDVFHPTYFDPYFLDYLNGKPFVLTVYDMIYELFPQYFPGDTSTVINKRKTILQADRIIAISEQTKKDVIRFFPEVSEKIEVIYLDCSFPLLTKNIEKENYILFTGSRGGYKNFSAFAKSAAPLLVKYDLKLICTGHGFKMEENQLLSDLGITERTICRYASDNELIELYAKALMFVFPSLYEGFGIPVLEAFSAGCPAVLANTSSLPEIGADAAVYFDPYSIDDMRDQIERVLVSPSLQKELIAKGRERVKFFSWEKCAAQTMKVYSKVMGGI